MRNSIAAGLVGLLVVGWAAVPASAQYSAVTTPFGNAQDSFFENMGIGFGFNLPGAGFVPGDDSGPSGTIGLGPTGAPTPNLGIPITQGGGVAPPFGAGGAGGGLLGGGFGFGMIGGGGSSFFNGGFSQGSSRSFVMESPTVVVPNGGQGTIIDATQRPFVTGFIPVVGGYGPGPGYGLPASQAVSPLFERIQRLNAEGALRRKATHAAGTGGGQTNEPLAVGGGARQAASSAERGDLSVAEIRRRQAVEAEAADEELAGWIERARGAEAAGKRNVARIYYRMAASRATGDLKQQLQAKYAELGDDQR
jgi:hypothetical protein